MLQLLGRALLVGVAVLICLEYCQAAASYEEEEQLDRPYVNYDALFHAFIGMGDALFGTWTPANFVRQPKPEQT